ncbi:MAG: endonuclease MutS2 [Clostridia bacterium]|nr:endonuclease MutS2 [Clostridia bacterium]
MKERDLRVLEFQRIREMLAELAVSEMGRQTCLELEPSPDAADVDRLLRETEEASAILTYSGSNPVVWFSDIRDSLRLASIGSILPPRALLNVADALKATRTLRSALVTDREDTPLLTDLGSRLTTDRSLEEEIFNAILSEDEISDHASADLYAIRRQIRALNDRVRDRLNAIIRSPSTQKYLMDAIITVRNGRYVVPVKAECRQNVPGIVHDQSGTGSTLFIEPMSVVEIGNELKQWTAKERAEIDRILLDLSGKIAPDADLLRATLELMARLDCVFAKARLARSMNGVMPRLNREGRIHLVRARHPLIDPAAVVPITLWIGTDFTTLVITGPNTGGKTVTLKTVGLLTLMAQAGLHIPAAYGSELSVFTEVFADIGDEQSIEQSLSTFSSHMRNIVEILDNVTRSSLVLFDELGAGTDPTEGAALAMSILDRLHVLGVTTMATTHYSELKAYALSTPGIENASVEFDVATLRPTYRLSIGIPGKSNAFEISRKLGLSEALINDAKERLSHDQVRFEDVIANAEYHRQIAEREQQLAEEAHRETARLRDEAEKLRRELEDRRESELRKAKEEARQIVKRAKQESEQLIAELRKSRTSGLKEHEIQAIRAQLQDNLDATGESLTAAQEEAGEAPKALKAGDSVLLLDLNTRATVLTAPDAKGDCMVQAGAIKMKSNIARMRLSAPAAQAKPKTRTTVNVGVREVRTECDVRGCSLDEALMSVDLFLDSAALNHLHEVYIIHGKGTGTLRAGIQKHLKQLRSVKSFRLGKYGEGEDGVTVVELK